MIEQFNAGTSEQVLAIRNLWKQLLTIVRSPTICENDEKIILAWGTWTHRLEIEIDRSGAIHWFFEDTNSGKSFGTDNPLPPGTELPEEVILFAQRTFA
jgi:hypothetical protein